MLSEIECDKLVEKRISFSGGLNVLVGDQNGSNSIGKSTFLMIIDFCFGGNGLIDHNKDTFEHVGHFTVFMTFVFVNTNYRFRRETANPNQITQIFEDGKVSQPIEIGDFCILLSKKYGLSEIDYSFRGVISTYSRIWGKDNYSVARPLHTGQRPEKDSIIALIALFNKWGEVKGLLQSIKSQENSRSILGKAFTQDYLTKITKKSYEINVAKILDLEVQLLDIENNLAKYSLNISEITSKTLIGIKKEKDKYISLRSEIMSKLDRIQLNLDEQVKVRKSDFEALSLIFPGVNLEHLEDIEEFHEGLANIVKREIRNSEKVLQKKLRIVDQNVAVLDIEIGALVKNIENPSGIIDSVVSLTKAVSRAKSENYYYETFQKLITSLRTLKTEYVTKRNAILENISKSVNDEVRKLNERISGVRRIPRLDFEKNSYRYGGEGDTGTGKAYIDLLKFDLALLKITSLPFLIHDSILYKNVENDSIFELFKVYSEQDKQVFAAVDEITKYTPDFVKLIGEHRVLQLSRDRVLFGVDWGKRKNLTSGSS